MRKFLMRTLVVPTLAMLAALACSALASAAQFQLQASDGQGRPLADVVAALVPIAKPSFKSPAQAVIDQRDKQFMPRVMAIRTNTLVRFPNSDDIRHHVYSFSPAKKFELRLYHGMTAEPVLFDKPGTVVLGCNIHDSMVAYLYVVDTDYFAVSDDQGRLHISAPAGNYQLQIYHPQLTAPVAEQTLALSETQPVQQKITLDNLAPAQGKDADDEFADLF